MSFTRQEEEEPEGAAVMGEAAAVRQEEHEGAAVMGEAAAVRQSACCAVS